MSWGSAETSPEKTTTFSQHRIISGQNNFHRVSTQDFELGLVSIDWNATREQEEGE